jgi:formyltetrahydrofolate deformylase
MKILKVKCVDQVGIISKISTVLFKNNINIIRLNEYVEPLHNSFFFRAEIEGDNSSSKLQEELTHELGEDTSIEVSELSKKKVVILATSQPHCLGDLLLREKSDSLNIDIQCVIANQDKLQDLTEKFDKPFKYISHEDISREEHAKRMMVEIDKCNPDYIILAKYMRFLPKDFVDKYKNKIINIHHSFLPAFIGANPYQQAYERGVKIIGATSHFVTIDLDEGPIIEQNILHIDHSYSAKELSNLGKDVEQLVLSKAVKYVCEDRVFVHENKTVVFK